MSQIGTNFNPTKGLFSRLKHGGLLLGEVKQGMFLPWEQGKGCVVEGHQNRKASPSGRMLFHNL